MNIGSSINAARIFFRRNSGVILTATAVGLTVFAIVEAVRATSKAKDIIDELEYEKFEELNMPEDETVDYHLEPMEVLKGVWKCYILTILLGSAAVTCCICSHINSSKKISAMSVAYASLLETYNTYKDNVQKNVSRKENLAISHGTVHDILEKDPVPEKLKTPPTLVISDDHQILLRDAYSAKTGTGYFKMTMDEVRKAEGKFNKYLMDAGTATLNDWYDFLGIGHSDLGDIFGWSWAENGPLYVKVIPDDIDVSEDTVIVSALGLAPDEGCTYFSMPSKIY